MSVRLSLAAPPVSPIRTTGIPWEQEQLNCGPLGSWKAKETWGRGAGYREAFITIHHSATPVGATQFLSASPASAPQSHCSLVSLLHPMAPTYSRLFTSDLH